MSDKLGLELKEDIIQAVADMLPILNAENVVIEKKGKLIMRPEKF